MKKLMLFLALAVLLAGCAAPVEKADLAATTLPVYEFTLRLCEGTGLTVTRLVTENVSCLHDYSLNVRQVRSAEAADTVVISGAGLEEFMEDLLHDKDVIDSGAEIHVLEDLHSTHDHGHDHHHHEGDNHIWLSPENAKVMAQNICSGLTERYPSQKELFEKNLSLLLSDIDALQSYGRRNLENLSCRDMITFHDGFGHMAESFDLHILEAVEEESGAEASASELKHLITLVREHSLPAIFTETNGSDSAAAIIAAETGAKVYTLDMAMSGDSWFDAMYRNIDTLKEALG